MDLKFACKCETFRLAIFIECVTQPRVTRFGRLRKYRNPASATKPKTPTEISSNSISVSQSLCREIFIHCINCRTLIGHDFIDNHVGTIGLRAGF